MNPYRNPIDERDRDEPSGEREDMVILWLIFASGAVLVLGGAFRPGPWDAWGTFGMLLSLLAASSLVRHYAAKIRSARSRARRRGAREG
jgi:hypothetical protein